MKAKPEYRPVSAAERKLTSEFRKRLETLNFGFRPSDCSSPTLLITDHTSYRLIT